MAKNGGKSKSFVTLALVLLFAVVAVSCPRMADKRYLTFDVRPVEVSTGRGKDFMEEYQPCQEIRGAESGKILKKVASPGDRIQIRLGVDYDFRFVTDKYAPWTVDTVVSKYLVDAQDEWQRKKDAYTAFQDFMDFISKKGLPAWGDRPQPPEAEDPGIFDPDSVEHSKVVRIGPKTFRLIDPSLDDTMIVTITNAYECVFKLDKDRPGITDRVEKIAFCMNEGETMAEYVYPLEMTFPNSGEVTYYQPANQILTFRLYMKPGNDYKVATVLKKRGSEADEQIHNPKTNDPERDGYYQFSISPELESDKSYTLDKREIIISTDYSHPEE